MLIFTPGWTFSRVRLTSHNFLTVKCQYIRAIIKTAKLNWKNIIKIISKCYFLFFFFFHPFLSLDSFLFSIYSHLFTILVFQFLSLFFFPLLWISFFFLHHHSILSFFYFLFASFSLIFRYFLLIKEWKKERKKLFIFFTVFIFCIQLFFFFSRYSFYLIYILFDFFLFPFVCNICHLFLYFL